MSTSFYRSNKALTGLTGLFRPWWKDRRHRQSAHRPYTRKVTARKKAVKARKRARYARAVTRGWPRGAGHRRHVK